MPSRTYDPARTGAALLAQAGGVRRVVLGLAGEDFGRPARVPGWDVRGLVVHLAAAVEAFTTALAAPAPAGRAVLDPAGYLAATPDAGPREAAAGAPDPAARFAAAYDALDRALAGGLPDRTVDVAPGPMTALGHALTLLFELTVHADDLAAATGVPVPHDRQALAAVVRLLADALAQRAPGNAVELRVPPFAAVQCVPGPRHTRGTPPNVVETDPLTWLRLATGRLGWADALARYEVTASGQRADLSAYLPVLVRPRPVPAPADHGPQLDGR